MMKRALTVLLAAVSLGAGTAACADPIGGSGYPNATSPLGGTETVIGTQNTATSKFTVNQIGNYALSLLGPAAISAGLGYTPAKSGANTDITSLGGLTNPPQPHAATKVALQALATTAASVVVRDGYGQAGDSPQLAYVASPSACSLGSGSGDGGSQVPSADGKCWLASFAASGAPISEWGADPSGSSDATAKVQAAASALSGLQIPLLVDGAYKIGASGTGVTFPPGVAPMAGAFQGANPTAGPRFLCNNQAAYVCVTISGASGSNGLLANGIEGVSITGVGGTPVSGFIGLKFYNGYMAWAQNIKVTNADTCIVWESGTVAFGGGTFKGFNINAAQCKTHYMVVNGWPELTIFGGRIGDNGTGDYAASDAFLFENTSCTSDGCGPNTVTLNAVQINPGNELGCAFRWANYNGDGVVSEFKFSDDHVEMHTAGGTAVFCTDGTIPLLQQVFVSHMVAALGGANVPLFALNSLTALKQDYFSDNVFGGCTGATIGGSPAGGVAAIQDVSFSNNFGCNNFSATSNGAGSNRLVVKGDSWNGLTIAGAWDGALHMDGYFPGGITDTASGNVYMVEPPQSWTPLLALCGAGVTGCGTSAGTQTRSGQYQRTPTGGWTGWFNITMTASPGGSGFAEVEGFPLGCTLGNQSAAAGGYPGFATGFSGLEGAPSIETTSNNPAAFPIFAPNAAPGSITGLSQIDFSHLTSSTHFAVTVNCMQAK